MYNSNITLVNIEILMTNNQKKIFLIDNKMRN